ncbi:hypothetical protein [Clostridium ihumii]|uniref:hypothetical protein n=1 Tax=Clostridium ihumii TaxID=1470356 RepID=UPI000AD29F1E|nr:hypothetical protein [Clostridium ihumii]
MENKKMIIDEETMQVIEELRPLFRKAAIQSTISKIKCGLKELLSILFKKK